MEIKLQNVGFGRKRIQKLNILVRLILLSHFVLFSLTAQTPSMFEYPAIMLDYNLTMQSQSWGDLAEFQIDQGFIFRRSSTGRLLVWSLVRRTLLYDLFDGGVNFGNETCLGFDLGIDGRTLVIYLGSGKVLALGINQSQSLQQLSLFQSTSNSANINAKIFRVIQTAYGETVILWSISNGLTVIDRYDESGLSVGMNNSLISRNISIFRMKTCEKPNTNDSEYLIVVWKDDCFFQVYQCLVGGVCAVYRTFQSGQCSQAELLSTVETDFQLQFSQDCGMVILTSKGIGLSVYDIQQDNFTIRYTTTQGSAIMAMSFFQSQFTLIPIFLNGGQFILHSLVPTVLENILKMILPEYGLLADFSMESLVLMTANNSHMLTYSFYCVNGSLTLVPGGMCFNCPQYCSACNVNGTCSVCSKNYTLTTNNTCTQNGTVDTSNSTYNPTIDFTIPPIDNTNNTNNTASNISDTNDTANDSPVPQSTYEDNMTVEPKYEFQKTINDLIVSDSSEGFLDASVFSLNLLQLFPFAFLFIRFINFWSICSFYLFLGVKMPSYLYWWLKEIYDGINTSIFSSFGVHFNFNISGKEKVTGYMSEEFGISSDFLSTNMENFVILILSYAILFAMYKLKDALPQNSWLRKGIEEIDFPMAVIGQYVAIMNGFFMTLPVIQFQSFQNLFAEKINLTLHIVFIIISLSVVGVMISYLSTQTVGQSKSQKKIITDKQQLREWLINCLCNSILPACAVLGYPALYLAFNTGLFVLITYAAVKQKSFKLNSIILSLELTLFHLGFIVLMISDPQKHSQIFHITGMCLVIILFLGASHQLASFLFYILYEIYIAIKGYLCAVADDKAKEKMLSSKKKSSYKLSNKLKEKSTFHSQAEKTDFQDDSGKNFMDYSIHDTNKAFQKPIVKKSAVSSLRRKNNNKGVKFNQVEMKNIFHFAKSQTTKPQYPESIENIHHQATTIQKRKINFTRKYKQRKQLDSLKIEQKDKKVIFNDEKIEQSHTSIGKARKITNFDRVKSTKTIHDGEDSFVQSEKKKIKNSTFVSSKKIKNNFKIEVLNFNENSQLS